MTDSDELDLSTHSSTELLWRSVKMDLDVTRAYQSEQLQSLKGAILRQHERQKPKKTVKLHHLFKRKYLKRKAFQKALKYLKALKLRLKKKMGVSAVKDNCISTMNFMVLQNVNVKTVEEEPAIQSSVSPHVCERQVKNQAVQTGNEVFQEGSNKRTGNEVFQEGSNKPSSISPPTSSPAAPPVSNAHPVNHTTPATPPVFLLPATWGPWIQPVHALGTCCSSSNPPASLCAQQLLRSELSTARGSLPEVHSVNCHSTAEGYSLKDICEQLLLQFSAKDISKDSAKSKNCQNKDKDDSPILPTVEVFSNSVTMCEAHSNFESESNSLAKASELAEMRSQSTSPTETGSGTSLIPDLLRMNQCVIDHGWKKGDGRSTPDPVSKDVGAKLQQSNDCPVTVNTGQNNILTQKHACGLSDHISKMPSNSSQDILFEENSAQEQEPNGLSKAEQLPATSTQAQSDSKTVNNDLNIESKITGTESSATSTENFFKILKASSARKINKGKVPCKSVISSEINPLNTFKNVSRILFENQTNGDKVSELLINVGNDEIKSSSNEIIDNLNHGKKPIFDSSEDVTSIDMNSSDFELSNAAIRETLKISNVAPDPIPSNEAAKVAHAEKLRSTVDQSDISHHSKYQRWLSNPSKKGSESPKPQESKVLSQVQRTDMAIKTRNERIKSPAFEEIDPAEMENVLLVLRQQEQLHQNPLNPVTSASSNFIFKKIRKSPELPPELRRVKSVPSPPLKRQSPDHSSALQILEEEAKKSTLEDDDDIPETSPQPVIPPPKRRRLRLNPSPLPVRIQRNKVTEEPSDTPAVNSPKPSAELNDNDSKQESGDLQLASINHNKASSAVTLVQDSVSKKSAQSVRASKRLKNKDSNNAKKEDTVKETSNGLEKFCEESKQTKKTVYELVDELNGDSKLESKSTCKDIDKQPISNNLEPSDNNSKNTNVGVSITSIKATKHNAKNSQSKSEQTQLVTCDSPEFTNQIKERVDKLKRQWLLNTSNDEISGTAKVEFKTPFPVRPISPISSHATDISLNSFLLEKKMKALQDVPLVEIGRAHDIITHALLNPWRGLVARCVTRGFVCPVIESKKISRCLWDLRSNAGPKDITERITALNWKDSHPHAIKSLASMFVLALSREVPFVFEADTGEDDDTCSNYSDADHTGKKKTPIRLIASKQIFKGECIDGLNGLLMKMSMKDKEKLRTWSFPKFKQSRDWVLFGPLAYLKRKDLNYNTKALILQGELIAVKATRHILCGEKLSVSFAAIEKQLTN